MEAAVIIPLTVLAVICLFYILIFLYTEVEKKSILYEHTVNEAGNLSETYSFSQRENDSCRLAASKKEVTGYITYSAEPAELIKKRKTRKVWSRSYIIVEEDIIRKADYVLQ